MRLIIKKELTVGRLNSSVGQDLIGTEYQFHYESFNTSQESEFRAGIFA